MLRTATDRLPHEAGPARVVLVDDRPTVRAALTLSLSRPTLDVVGGFERLGDVASAGPVARPHVLLLSNGVTRQDRLLVPGVREAAGDPAVVVSSPHWADVAQLYDDEVVDAVLGPDAGLEQLRRTIHRVRAGERSLRGFGASSASSSTTVTPLTGREHQVLQLLAVGASNEVISERLEITVNTVRSHVQQILLKLGQSRRVRAVRRADELGLLRHEAPFDELTA